MFEWLEIEGVYDAICYGPDGVEKWRDTADNLVCIEGKNVLLNAGFSGSSYTVTGPFMGLISATGFSAITTGDTMAQLAGSNGWREAGISAPTYSGNRKTCLWLAASGGSKTLSAGLTFAMTGPGNIAGAFICFGSGAVSTIGSITGALYSAATFNAGAKTVDNSDTVTLSYTANL